MFGRFGQVHRRRLRFLCGGGYLHRGLVDRRDQRTQRFDREVHRVGDRAGDVLGHRGLDRQIAFGERSHFVEQAQNRFLVALVQFSGDLVALALAANLGDAEPDDEDNGNRRSDQTQPQVRPRTLCRQFGDAQRQRLGLEQHGLTVDRCLVRGLLDVLQSGRRVEQLLHRIGEIDPLLVDVAQDFLRVRVVHRADVEIRIAVDQTGQHHAVELRVARQSVGSGLRIFTTLQDRLHAALHAVGQQHFARRNHDLAGRAVLLGQRLDHFFHARVEHRHLAVEIGGDRAVLSTCSLLVRILVTSVLSCAQAWSMSVISPLRLASSP